MSHTLSEGDILPPRHTSPAQMMPTTQCRVLTLSDKAWAAHRQRVVRVASEAVSPSKEERQSRAEANLSMAYRLLKLRRTMEDLEVIVFGSLEAYLSDAGKLPPK
jgi:hypothetical protein